MVLRWAKAGETIIIGSRQQQKAEDAAKKARDALGGKGSVSGMENPKAAAAADIIVMSVPFAAHVDMIKSVHDSIKPDDVFVDVVVPLSTAVGGRVDSARSLGRLSRATGGQAPPAAHEDRIRIPQRSRRVIAGHQP